MTAMKVIVIGNYQIDLEREIQKRWTWEPSTAKASELFMKETFDVVVVGLHIGPPDGIAILELVKRGSPGTIVIITTMDKDPKAMMHCYEKGADGFLFEPLPIDELEFTIRRYMLEKERREELERYRSTELPAEIDDVLVGSSIVIGRVKNAILQYAASSSTVLIRGESGTGKGIAARLLHAYSPNKEGPFIHVNCTAIPESLMESELFGHEKGAFTNAVAQKPGLFELASGGTLFLDEIGELPLAMQVKLLTVLEEKYIRRIGGTRNIPIQVRICAATNKDMEKAIRDREFRDDLYYRLNVLTLDIPPLRERADDIPAIADRMLTALAKDQNKRIDGFSSAALAALRAYPWPGNVRELKNVIERALIHTAGRIVEEASIVLNGSPDFPAGPEPSGTANALSSSGVITLAEVAEKGMNTVLENFERMLIHGALEKHDGNQSAAARLLGIKRTTLVQKMKKLGI
ncbi:MAG: sigma-54 dependent transcriptional regulator [Spirochaetota bacterium]